VTGVFAERPAITDIMTGIEAESCFITGILTGIEMEIDTDKWIGTE
jgi:hypothetical protein